MVVRSESCITIASSVPDVWAYICDVGRWPEWAPTVHESWIGGGGPLQPGSRVEQRAKLIFGFTRYRAQKGTAGDAPRRVLEGRIRRVMDREMAAIKAALESATPGGPDASTASETVSTREHLIEI